MEEKERFGIEHEENIIQFAFRLKASGMSDLCMNKFVDMAWDDLCLSDDHIVPDPGRKRLDDHIIQGSCHKKRHRESVCMSSNIGDRSATRCVDQGGDQGGISSLSKRRNTMLEKESWSCKPDNALTSAFDSNAVTKASNLASGSTTPSAHGLKNNNRNSNGSEFCGFDSILDDKTSIVDKNSFNFPMGEITHKNNDINYSGNVERKNSGDLLYCDLPEIENFEDIDRMFRSCDSTFGLGVCKDDELSWLPSDDRSGNVLESDAMFTYPEPSEVDDISENHDFLNGYSINNSDMISAPNRYNDSSWTSEKSDSYGSFVIGQDVADSKDPQMLVTGPGLNDKSERISTNDHFRTGSGTLINEHKSQIKQETQSVGKSKVHYLGNNSTGPVANLPNDVGKLSSGLTSCHAHQSFQMQQQQHAPTPDSYSYSQNPTSYMQSDSSCLSDPSSVNLKRSIKSEINDLKSVLSRDSSIPSSRLQYIKGSPDPDCEANALLMHEQRKELHFHEGDLSSVHNNLNDGSVTIQASMSDPGLGGKYENRCVAEGVSLAASAELSSSNIQDGSSMGSDLDDISQEAASFRQLQLVMEQLDLRTKLSIRDSLYRLAKSAQQRHNLADISGCEEHDAGTKRYTSFMDMETNTNPIDRSVAHLLFHRHSDSSTAPAQDSFPFKSSSMCNEQAQGSVASLPVLADNLVGEEKVSIAEREAL